MQSDPLSTLHTQMGNVTFIPTNTEKESRPCVSPKTNIWTPLPTKQYVLQEQSDNDPQGVRSFFQKATYSGSNSIGVTSRILNDSGVFFRHGLWSWSNQKELCSANLERLHQVDQISIIGNGQLHSSEHRKHRAVVRLHWGPSSTRLVLDAQKSRRFRTAQNFVILPMHFQDVPHGAQIVH